jgi:hypothetical protein
VFESSAKPRGRRQAAQGRPLAAAEGSRLSPRWTAARPLSKSILEALDDPDLFRGMFDTPSWEPWLAFLEALQALPMSAEHLALYRKHTGRSEPPAEPRTLCRACCRPARWQEPHPGAHRDISRMRS